MIELGEKATIEELAEILGIKKDPILISLWMLKTGTGYHSWKTPKKSGGKRQIHNAFWPLSEIQARIASVVYPFSVSLISHGFVGGRSPRTAILPHLGANAFFTFDIKDAFPSTKKQQVRFSFCRCGFKKELASLMADLVCYSPNIDLKDGFIPLGYTSSPTIFNLLLKDIDRLLFDFAQKRGYQVTRFVDNFALSSTAPSIPEKDRRLAVKTVEGLSCGQFKVPDEKTEYLEAKAEVHFEFLGLAIRGPKNGKRELGVNDEKLGEYLFAFLEALEKRDFSEATSRHLQGAINYLKSAYKPHPLPPRLFDLHNQYKFLKQLANSAEKGELLPFISPFQK